MNLALAHDYLVQDGGAEQVLRVMQDIWPKAPTYVLFHDAKKIPDFNKKDIRTSYLQKLPLALKHYQWYLMLMPSAIESLDLSTHNVVISSASAFAKGLITSDDAIHICYCHSPTRYLWSDTHSYIEELNVPRIIKTLLPPLLSRLRLWDRQAADRVDFFIANSEAVKRRIKKYYRRDSVVIHPPVDISRFYISDKPKNFFLTGGRLVPYKRFDLAIEAANQTGLPLIIFGNGPAEKDLKAMAGPTIRFVGRVSDQTRAKLFAEAKAFINPQEEDFGITPVESMASGRPVIAFRRGGSTESVVEGLSGEFFDDQCWEELADHMIRFDTNRYDPATIRKHAEKFGTDRFQNKLKTFVRDHT